MAARKHKKRQTKKKTAGSKMTRMKKTAKKKLAMKRGTPKKKVAKKKASQKKSVVKTKAVRKKTIAVKKKKKVSTLKKLGREKNQSVDTVALSPEEPGGRSGRQSGDLQGLSDVEGADSESVDELLEEGNAFEANVVTGVEDAGKADEKEVRTHEVPEDDVPDEYLDKE
ncbi:MAG: hypothetical protein ACHP8A_14435 [Terriglobales bacterium]|jgi:cell wall-associated NlpC family hydrolase